jgi:hypothetical protein
MKNYLDLVAINDPGVEIELVVDCIINNGIPDLKISINNREFYNKKINQKITIITKIPLLEQLKIQIKLDNKRYSEVKETAVIIESFSIDGHQMVGNYDAMVNYTNDQNVNYQGFYLGFNGTWRFEIEEPFYQWLHRTTGQGWLLKPASVQS